MQNARQLQNLSGGLFLIGLGILFLMPGVGFWPWILVVIGVSQLPASLASKRGWYGWQGFFWLVGLAIIFASGMFWPLILILVGLNVLLGAAMRDSAGSPFSGHKAATPAPAEPVAGQDEAEPFAPTSESTVSTDTRRLDTPEDDD
jgi:hypothetical protein